MNNPYAIQTELNNIIADAMSLEGHLSNTEMEFLAINAAIPSAVGVVLEIGSFKGKSTCILAKASMMTSDPFIIAVDPLTHDSLVAHDLQGSADEQEFQHDFFKNLQSFQVQDRVQFHQKYSYDFVKSLSGKIRFLWVDGDHSYEGVKRDIELFTPFLADGAIVAMHDVLHNLDGPIRCFAEDILKSQYFGRAGVCGSIGWGQYHSDAQHNHQYFGDKTQLFNKINQLIPYALHHPKLKGWTKLRYKMKRARVPHGKIILNEWRLHLALNQQNSI